MFLIFIMLCLIIGIAVYKGFIYRSQKSNQKTENIKNVVNSNITYEIKTEIRKNDAGDTIISYEYPVFSCEDEAYSAIVKELNQNYLELLENDLNSEDSNFADAEEKVVEGYVTSYTQKVFDISITKDNNLSFIEVGRTQEVGAPHPINYNESYVINMTTADFAKLSDVVTFDDNKVEEITEQIYADHSDKDYDTLKKDIQLAISNDKAGWRIDGDSLVIWFEYEDITGAYQGDGEYAAIVSFNNFSKTSQIQANEAASSDDGDSSQLFDYEQLGVSEYEYPSEFELEDDLKEAMIQLGLHYDSFGDDDINRNSWEDDFISMMILNTRCSFGYLDEITEESHGLVTKNQAEYIQYSLTDVKLDFSMKEDEELDLSEASSGYGFGDILSYDFQEKEDGINLTAVLGVGHDGSDEYIKQMKLNFELIKNPYSCFDGYSIKSLTAENITPFIEADGLEHTFYGSDTYFEEEGVFALEFAYADDDLNYGQFVYIDLSGNEELVNYVRENAGSDFKVTYRLDDSNSSLIEEVVPVKIEVVENGIGAE